MTTTKAPPTIAPTFCHKHRPWWIGVKCEWHNPHGHVGSGCMVCGPVLDRVEALARSPEWKRWKLVLLADGDASLVVGDWLEENGWPELADEARRTWTHEAACPTCKGRGKVVVNRHGRTAFAFANQTCRECQGTGKRIVVETMDREKDS